MNNPIRRRSGGRAGLLAGLFALLFAGIGFPAPSAETMDIRLNSVAGDATILTASGKREIPVQAGMPLDPGDRVRTGASSSAEVSFHGGESLISIGSNSRFLIKSSRGENRIFELTSGAVFSHIGKSRAKKNPVTILTPTASAIVHGTEFGVEVVGEGKNAETYVGVFDSGKVAVGRDTGEPTERLITNQETRVRYGSPPAIPYQLERLAKHRRHVRELKAKARRIRKKWKTLTPAKMAELRHKALEQGAKSLDKRKEVQAEKKSEQTTQAKEAEESRRNRDEMNERRRRINNRRREKR